MQNVDNSAQILDFTAFLKQQQRQDIQPVDLQNATPMLIWYPVWVLVPNAPAPVTP